MNELKVIKVTPGAIQTNFNEFHETLKLAVNDYKGLVVTEDNLKEMNSTRLELTKAIKIINKERILQKKEFIKPLTVYEDQCKTAIATIEEAEKELKGKINYFDEITRQSKRDYAVKTAMELATSLELEYQNRLDVEKDSYVLKGTKEKDIFKDIAEQVAELEKLQKAKYSNEQYVLNQLITASKLANLSTDLVIDDISHLISNYEELDIAAVTNGINQVAERRQAAEQLAIKQMEERVRAEEKAKAEAKERAEREKILAEERIREREERAELERLRKIEADKLEVIRQAEIEAKAIIKEPIMENQATIEEFEPQEQVQFVSEAGGFVSIEEAEEFQDDIIIDEITVIKVTCKYSEAKDIVRLLALNNYDCEVE